MTDMMDNNHQRRQKERDRDRGRASIKFKVGKWNLRGCYGGHGEFHKNHLMMKNRYFEKHSLEMANVVSNIPDYV